MRKPLRFFFTVVIGVVLALGIGCKAKASLDADVDHLLTAIGNSDYEHFKADAHPDLVKEVSKQEFDEDIGQLRKLGPLTSKTMTSVETSSGTGGTQTKGAYNLVFQNGKCNLAIRSIGGKVAAFHFQNCTLNK